MLQVQKTRPGPGGDDRDFSEGVKVRFPKEHDEALRGLAEDLDVSFAEVVRAFVKQGLEASRG